MDLVPSGQANGTVLVGNTFSGATIVASTFSGGTIAGSTISGSTLIGPTSSGGTFLNSTISGATMIGGTISGTSLIGVTVNSGSTVSIYASPARQFVSVHRNGSAQSINSGADTKVQNNTEAADADGVYDNATNYRMTPTISGTFLVTTAAEFVNMDDNENIETQIWKTGSKVAYARGSIAGTGIDRGVVCSAYVTVNGSSDYIEHYVQHNHGSARNISGSAANTYMQAIWVSR